MGTFQQPLATRTYDRGGLRIDSDGTVHVRIQIKDAAGKDTDSFEVRLPTSGAITDERGNTIAANVPAGIANGRTSFLAALDTAIDSAAAAGKFSR